MPQSLGLVTNDKGHFIPITEKHTTVVKVSCSYETCGTERPFKKQNIRQLYIVNNMHKLAKIFHFLLSLTPRHLKEAVDKYLADKFES